MGDLVFSPPHTFWVLLSVTRRGLRYGPVPAQAKSFLCCSSSRVTGRRTLIPPGFSLSTGYVGLLKLLPTNKELTITLGSLKRLCCSLGLEEEQALVTISFQLLSSWVWDGGWVTASIATAVVPLAKQIPPKGCVCVWVSGGGWWFGKQASASVRGAAWPVGSARAAVSA